MNQKVYIIIVNYNGWPDTIECLESVFRNNYRNYQVLVIDNNSLNNSVDYIKAWAEGSLNVRVGPDNLLRYLTYPPIEKEISYAYYNRKEAERGGYTKLEENLKVNVRKSDTANLTGPTTDLPLVLIQSGDNLGFAGGVNVGLRYALAKDDFDYIWLLNNDTVIERESLRNLLLHASSRHVLGSLIAYYDNPEHVQAFGGGNLINFLGIPRLRFKGVKVNDITKRNLNDNSLDYLTGCSMFISRDTLKNAGFFSEAYFMYWEDTEWCFRIRSKGYGLKVVAESVVYHKEGVSIGFKSFHQQSLDMRNTILFYLKKKPLYLPSIILLKPIANLISRFKHRNFSSVDFFSSLFCDFSAVCKTLRHSINRTNI